MTETYKCPRCIEETLAKSLGNLLVCPNCDVIYVTPAHVNNPINHIEVLHNQDPGDEQG